MDGTIQAQAPVFLDVRNLTVAFDSASGPARAVNDVSYRLGMGETLGIVGESGSGKSVHVLSMLGLLPSPPGRIVAGEVLFEGQNLLALSPASLRDIRGAGIGIIFQDPMSSLNPVLTIERQIGETLVRHLGLDRRAARLRTTELLDMVRIPQAKARLRQYPHELSGGQRQRVMIAIALACRPRLLVADEATTALDVTIQAEIIDLIRDLQREIGMGIIWISHDLGVVARLADTVQVMYAGRILERGPVRDIFYDPRNAYTLGLLQSLPDIGAKRGTRPRLSQIPGSPPDLRNLPPGDPFAPRNPYATARCHKEMPPLTPVRDGNPAHLVAAWYDLREARLLEGDGR